MMPKSRYAGIKKILIDEKTVQFRVRELADKISEDYAGKKLLIIAVLKGSVIFLSDLLRYLKINPKVDFVSVSSYKGAKSSGQVELHMDLRQSIKNRDVLIVDEIIDSGYTLSYLLKSFKGRNPKSVKSCVLLDKKALRKVRTKVDYRGFEVPPVFLVGYGLDYKEKYRNVPYIGILKSSKI